MHLGGTKDIVMIVVERAGECGLTRNVRRHFLFLIFSRIMLSAFAPLVPNKVARRHLESVRDSDCWLAPPTAAFPLITRLML